MSKTRYYLAYGSNLHVAQMKRRCPGAIAVGRAWLEGWKLAFRGSKTGAYLTIIPDPDSVVPIGVWKITDADERALDFYEGYPTFYYKDEFELTLEPFKDGARRRKITGMVYIMAEDRPTGVPSQIYVNTCSVGYDCFGFYKEPLMKAVRESIEENAPKDKPIKRRKRKVTA